MPTISRDNKANSINVKTQLRHGLTYTIYTYGGNDIVYGYNLAEIVFGGDGNDTIKGYNGKDRLYGQNGNDNIDGGNHNDRIYGGDGHDKLKGGNHNDTIYGDKGNDKIWGGKHHDKLKGGDDKDKVKGGHGKDKIWGNDGDDKLWGGKHHDKMWGGDGYDKIKGQHGKDKLYGGDGNDKLWGGDHNDYLDGGDDDDKLHGGNGNDILKGGHGNDKLYGENHHDKLYGGHGNDTLDGGHGHDKLYGEHGNDTLAGGKGNDILVGGQGNDKIYGDEGNDTVTINLQTDIDTKGANELADGGSGFDTLILQLDERYAKASDINEIKQAVINHLNGDSGYRINVSKQNVYYKQLTHLDVKNFSQINLQLVKSGKKTQSETFSSAKFKIEKLIDIKEGDDYISDDDNALTTSTVVAKLVPFFQQIPLSFALQGDYAHYFVLHDNGNITLTQDTIDRINSDNHEENDNYLEGAFALRALDIEANATNKDGNTVVKTTTLHVTDTNDTPNLTISLTAESLTEEDETLQAEMVIATLNANDPEGSDALDFELQSVLTYNGVDIFKLNQDSYEVYLTQEGVYAINDDAFRQDLLADGIIIEAKVVDHDVVVTATNTINITEVNEIHSLSIVVNETLSDENASSFLANGSAIATIFLTDPEGESIPIKLVNPQGEDDSANGYYMSSFELDGDNLESTIINVSGLVMPYYELIGNQVFLTALGAQKATDINWASFNIEVEATDSEGNTVTKSSIVEISHPNTAPVINSLTQTQGSLVEDSDYQPGHVVATFDLIDNDQDATLSLLGSMTQYFQIDKENGEIELTDDTALLADFNALLEKDGDELLTEIALELKAADSVFEDIESISLTVEANNDAPTLVGPATYSKTTAEHVGDSFNAKSYFDDVDSDFDINIGSVTIKVGSGNEFQTVNNINGYELVYHNDGENVGEITFDPKDAFYFLKDGEKAKVEFNFWADDGDKTSEQNAHAELTLNGMIHEVTTDSTTTRIFQLPNFNGGYREEELKHDLFESSIESLDEIIQVSDAQVSMGGGNDTVIIDLKAGYHPISGYLVDLTNYDSDFPAYTFRQRVAKLDGGDGDEDVLLIKNVDFEKTFTNSYDETFIYNPLEPELNDIKQFLKTIFDSEHTAEVVIYPMQAHHWGPEPSQVDQLHMSYAIEADNFEIVQIMGAQGDIHVLDSAAAVDSYFDTLV